MELTVKSKVFFFLRQTTIRGCRQRWLLCLGPKCLKYYFQTQLNSATSPGEETSSRYDRDPVFQPLHMNQFMTPVSHLSAPHLQKWRFHLPTDSCYWQSNLNMENMQNQDQDCLVNTGSARLCCFLSLSDVPSYPEMKHASISIIGK